MDMAAPAIFDAPQPRAPSRAPAPESQGPSFDEHLEKAVQEETSAPETEARDSAPAEQKPEPKPAPQQTQPTNDAATPPAPVIAPPPTAPIMDLAPPVAPPTQSAQPISAPTQPSAPPTGAQPAAPCSTPDMELAGGPTNAPTQTAPSAGQGDAAKRAANAETPAQPQTAPQNAVPVATPDTAQQQQQQQQAATAAPVTPPDVAAQLAAAAPTPPVAPTTQMQAQADASVQPIRNDGARAKREAPPTDAPAQTTPAAAAQPNTRQTPKTAQNNTAAIAKDAFLPATADAGSAPSSSTQTASAAAAAHTASTQHASATAEHDAARAAPAAAQVSREIVRRFNGGATQFELRLDPAELGRVDVKLEVSRDHRVTAVISADSPQALSDLMRHARDLEQSLQSAGLDLAENGLSFDLRQGTQDGDAQSTSGGARGSNAARNGGEQTQTESAPATARLERWRGVRVDVMA